MRAIGVLLPAFGWLLGGCGPAPAEPGSLRTVTVRLEVGEPSGEAAADASHGGGRVSVVSGVTLTTTTPEGVSTQSAAFGTGHPQAQFQVRVPEGPVEFHAAVTSSIGVLLYEGVREVIVDRDGFQADIPLVARAPVLMVTPDSLRATPAGVPPGPALFLLRNEGIERVQWRVASISPGLQGCGPSACLNVFPLSGFVSAGGAGPTGFLQVELLITPERIYRLVLETDQGNVELVVDAAGAGTLEARVQRSISQTGAPIPVSGNQVRLRACAGGTAGIPGSCIPDPGLPIRFRTTGADGTVRFAGLPSGLWEIQPDPLGWQSMQPTRQTVSLPAGGFTSILFQATAIGSPPEG